MKKALKSLVLLTFCICMIMSTMVMASAVGNVTGAKATNVTYNSATLTWKKASSCDGYEIQQYKSKKWTNIKTISSASTVSYKVTKLTTGTTYKYRVRAYDKTLFGTKYSPYVNITVKPLPVKVTGLKATSASYNSVKLTWTKVAGATGYQVQMYKGGKWVTIKNPTTNSLTVTGLTTGTSYSFRVKAYRTVSKTKHYSAAYSATVKCTPIPAATSKITVSGETETSVKLTWTKVAGATGYQVYNPATKKWLNAGTKLTYTLKSLKANSKYTAKVRAVRKVGSKTFNGAEKSITFVSLPAKITNVKTSNVTSNSFKISWTKASNITKYRVFVYDYSTKKETKTDTTKTSLTLSNLVPGVKYRIAVRAFAKNNNEIYGAKSSYVYQTTYTTKSVPLSWSAVADATSYTIERFNPVTHAYEAVGTSNTTSYVDTYEEKTGGLYRITAYNGTTALSSIEKEFANASFTLNKTANGVKVTWQAPVPGEGKSIRYYTVYELPRKGSGETEEKLVYAIDTTDTTHSMFTSYGTEQTYVIYANYNFYKYTNNEYRDKVAQFTVGAKDLVIDNTDTSKNGQLLMLAEAINRTKYDQETVTVTQDSAINMTFDKITLSPGMYFLMGVGGISTDGFEAVWDGIVISHYECKGTDNIVKFMQASGESTTAEEVNVSEKINETVRFSNGIGGGKYLETYIEPSTTYPYNTYIYNGDKVAKWDDGFSGVTTTKLANGNYSFTGTIKAETYGTSSTKKAADYHSGFTTAFDSLNFGNTDGMGQSSTTISKTKITAEITPDGKLVSYTLGDTSMKMEFGMSMGETDDGDDASMGMYMSGNCKFSYTFER